MTFYFLLVKNGKIDEAMRTAVMCIEYVIEHTAVPKQELHRSREFTNELFDKIDTVSCACANTAFTKKRSILFIVQ